MKANQLDEALATKFLQEGHRLVFWHDADGEFADYIAAGLTDDLAQVQVLEVAQVGGLSAKLKLEQEDTSNQYLVYSKGQLPPAEHDWLLDMRIYSGQFKADAASIWLQDLGLTRLALCDHLNTRSAFLKSAERRRKLSRLVHVDDDEQTLDLKMLAVLSGSTQPLLFDVLMAICDRHVVHDKFALDQEPVVLADFRKKGLDEFFWNTIATEFGYSEEVPGIDGLLRRLLVTELLATVGDKHLLSLAQFKLPDTNRRQVSVFLTQWRDSASRGQCYNAVSEAISTDLNIAEQLQELEWESLVEVNTFWVAARMVVSALSRQLLDDMRPAHSDVHDIILQRGENHWLAGVGSDRQEPVAVAQAYQAIDAAAQLLDFLDQVQGWVQVDDAEQLLTDYRDRWYQVDQLYRLFHTHITPSNNLGWNLMKPLTERVEGEYDQRFIQPLGIAWSALLDHEPDRSGEPDGESGFLQRWQSTALPPQQGFYQRVIAPWLANSPRRRAFVIISDALRFEVADELAGQIKGRYRIEAELSAMLGVLPSYTGLGMASLLPHESLSYNTRGDVLADGASTAGLEARSKLLASVEGIACKADDLMAMKKEAARSFIDGARVVYIYHNEIDAVGDSASTESDTFEAVSRAVDSVTTLVTRCVNDLNAGRVWVTADHGFLFQVAAPEATDRTALIEKPSNTLKSKKRYVIGRNLGDNPDAHFCNTAVTAGTASDNSGGSSGAGSPDFWVPRGANRFHFTGGARFVHGGAMPQEVIVPLLSVSAVSGKKKATTKVEPVGIQIMGANHKITTPVHRFTLLQTEPVSDRRFTAAVRIAVYENDQPVTTVERVSFDSASDRAEDRQRTVKLQLGAGPFDKRTAYYLRLHYLDSQKEACSVPVVIDRSFDDDF